MFEELKADDNVVLDLGMERRRAGITNMELPGGPVCAGNFYGLWAEVEADIGIDKALIEEECS